VSRQYPDIPEHIRISDQPVRCKYVEENQRNRPMKLPWTPALATMAYQMRVDGETWEDIAGELADCTGVLLDGSAVQSYIKRHFGDRGEPALQTPTGALEVEEADGVGQPKDLISQTVRGGVSRMSPPHFTKHYPGR
jgi:hypothetical protein